MSARPTATDFGVVIPAKSEHLHWVRGTCASVRYFMGDTPICVVLDGEEFLDELRKSYDLEVCLRRRIRHGWARGKVAIRRHAARLR